MASATGADAKALEASEKEIVPRISELVLRTATGKIAHDTVLKLVIGKSRSSNRFSLSASYGILRQQPAKQGQATPPIDIAKFRNAVNLIVRNGILVPLSKHNVVMELVVTRRSSVISINATQKFDASKAGRWVVAPQFYTYDVKRCRLRLANLCSFGYPLR